MVSKTCRALSFLLLMAAAPASQWQSLGLGGGGQILMIAPDPSNPSTVYLGSDVAGLWRSDDQGTSWQYLTPGWTPNFCQSLAFDPTNNNRMLIALSEGVFESDDRGQTWFKLVSATNVGARAVARDGGGHLVVYFGTGLARDTRSLNDPSHPRLDFRRLFPFNWRVHSRSVLVMRTALYPSTAPKKPEKSVGASDSPTVYCG